MAIDLDLKTLTATKLKTVILTHNLIIHTKSFTIDTSKFAVVSANDSKIGADGSDGVWSNVSNNVQSGGRISLVYNGANIDPQAIITSNKVTKDSLLVTIPIKMIEKITVKSKRNFLLNQTDITSK